MPLSLLLSKSSISIPVYVPASDGLEVKLTLEWCSLSFIWNYLVNRQIRTSCQAHLSSDGAIWASTVTWVNTEVHRKLNNLSYGSKCDKCNFVKKRRRVLILSKERHSQDDIRNIKFPNLGTDIKTVIQCTNIYEQQYISTDSLSWSMCSTKIIQE